MLNILPCTKLCGAKPVVPRLRNPGVRTCSVLKTVSDGCVDGDGCGYICTCSGCRDGRWLGF